MVSLIQGTGSVVSLVQCTGSVVHYIVPVIHVTSPVVKCIRPVVSLVQRTGPVQEASSVATDQDWHGGGRLGSHAEVSCP